MQKIGLVSMRWLLGMAVMAAGFVNAAEPVEFEPVTVPLKVQKVSAHAYYVRGESGLVSTKNQGFNSNAGFVVTPEGVVVFDALGTPALGKAFIDEIRKVTPLPIKKLIISHYHSDHFYGIQAFRKLPGVEIIAQNEVRNYLASPAPAARLQERKNSLYPWVNNLTTLGAPDRYIGDKSSFKLGGYTFHIFHVGPAHTPEDLIMLFENESVLFAGDILFAGRIPFVGDAKIEPWLQAIKRVAAFKPKILVSGHGDHSLNASADLALTRDYLTFLQNAMTQAYDKGLDFDEAYAKTDWSRFAKVPLFEAANRNNAYNTFLNIEQQSLSNIKK